MMVCRSSALLSLTIVLATWTLTHAYGPMSHYSFTCAALTGEPACSGNETLNDLLSGTVFPDAYFFGDFITGRALPCSGYSELHNPVLAGLMVQEAMAMEEEKRASGSNVGSSVNLVDFALGYGAHIVADATGFLRTPTGGLFYLGTGQLSLLDQMGVNWISVWPHMASIDSYVYNQDYSSTPISNLPRNKAEYGEFFNRVTTKFASQGYPVISPEQVHNCSEVWQDVVTIETNKAKAMPAAMYEFEMTYNDVFQEKNFTAVAATFEKTRACAISAIQLWKTALVDNKLSAAEAIQKVVSFVASNCPHT